MRFLRSTCLVLCLLVAGGVTLAADDTLDFDVIFGDNPGGRVPGGFAWSPTWPGPRTARVSPTPGTTATATRYGSSTSAAASPR